MSTFEGADVKTVINMKAVEAADTSPVPAGVYAVVFEGCEYKLSQSSNQPMWAIRLKIIDHEEHEGRVLFTNWSFSPKAISITKNNLAAVRPDLADSDELDLEESAGEMIGEKARVRVKMGENQQGEPRPEVKAFMPYKEGTASGGSFL